MRDSGSERTIRLLLEYHGGRFHGWQVQRGRRTVQEELQRALLKVTGERVTVWGASRTDAGVHATGQVAHFRTKSRLSPERLMHALNFYLPGDVAIRRASRASPSFHAQFGARAKRYRYAFLNSRVRRPLLRDRSLLVRIPLDVAAMQRAARLFVGTHDFRAFGREVFRRKTTVRTVFRSRVFKRGEMVLFEVTGDGFLYNMVRCMAGTLMRVGQGKIPPSEVGRILREGDRKAAGPVLAPHGLCLVQVSYRGTTTPG